jgi:type IV secretion system protein VirD4
MIPDLNALLPGGEVGWFATIAALGFLAWFIIGFLHNDIGGWWRKRHPINRVAEDGPWRGGFMNDADLKQLTSNPSGLPLGLYADKIARYVKNDDRGWLGGHHAVIAGTRGGKSVSALVPAILDHAGPVVALDIKGELATITGKRRKAAGRKVAILDPFATTGFKGTLGFNPLSFIRSEHRDRDAAVIADGLVMAENGDGAHFADRARDCLATAIEVVHELEGLRGTLHDVRKLVLSATFADTLGAWTDKPELAGGRAAELAGSFLNMGDKERGSILSTVARSLRWTSAQHMRDFLDAEGFRLDMLLGGETDLFIVVPLDQIGPQAGFLRLLTNQLLTLMVQQDQRGKAAKPVLFVADEFTRLGYLQRVVDIATVAAGMSLETIFVLQDRGSLEAVYGQYAVDTILGSCATVRVFNLGRADLRTAEWLSKASGYKTVLTEGKSFHSASKDQTTNQSEAKEPLLSVSDILELPADQTICLIRGKSPAKLNRIKWYNDERYRK